MNERWVQVRGKLLGFWNQYSKTQKWILGSTAALLILAIIILTYIFTRTQYEIAFQNLDNADAAAIVQYLEGNGISYKLGDAGTSISVPSASASRVKVDVGSQGLVQNGSIGFAEMSGSSSAIGTTDQEFRVKYRNMLNGEVQQLLQGMQGVERAKALVNLPEESVFLNQSDRERASASITLQFRPGYRPKQEEIDSYFNLVKTAVPNLAIEDITISSPTGELVPSDKIGGGGVGGGVVESQFEIKRKFENEIKRNVQTFLTPIVGMDNMVVSVVSSLNFDKKTTQENLVRPLEGNDNRGIIVSETDSASTFTGTDRSPGGVAGTGATEVPNYPGAAGGASSESEETSSTRNYDYDKITNNIEFAPFKVQDLTISVAVDSAVLTEESQGPIRQMLVQIARTQLAESGLELTDEQIEQRVSLIAQPFSGLDTGGGGIAPSTYWFAGVGGLAAVLLAVGAVMYYRRRKAAQQAAELAAATAAARPELPTIDIDSVSSESQVRKQLESLAKRKPEEFVNLLRTWLVDE